MSRIPGRVLWTVGTLAIVVAMAQVAEAQREGGRRGGRGFGGRGGGLGAISAVQLAADSEEVQTALNLNDDQMAKVEEINDQLRDDRRELFQGGGGDFRAMREDMEKLNTEANAKLAEVLDDNQKKRLMGIQIQVNGANMLLDAAVAKELSITEDQTAQLEEARDDNMRAMRDAFEDIQDLSREERRAKQQELRTEADNKLLAVLTDDQKSKFEALKGEAVEVDMSQFRGGFGGRGGGGGGRNRDRDRDRDDDSDQGV